MANFFAADSGSYGPEVNLRRAKLGEALLSNAVKQREIINPWQGVSQIGEAIIGGMIANKADRAEREGSKAATAVLASLLAGGQPAAANTPDAQVPIGQSRLEAPQADIKDLALSQAISNAAATYGVDPAYLSRIAAIESGGNVNATNPNSSARGPFQFINSTARRYGLTNPSDPNASADAAARLTIDNKAALARALGREPTHGELYLAHQQGAGGAAKILANPNMPIEQVVGMDAARFNGGVPGMTAGQFAQKWTSRLADNAQPPQPQGAQAQIAAALGSSDPYVVRAVAPLAEALVKQQMQGPKLHKLNDEMLFDERTGKTMAAGPGFKPIITPEDRARFGIPVEDKRPYQVGPGNKLINPPPENRINIDQKGEGSFEQTAGKLQAERFDELVKGGMSAKSMISDMSALKDIGSRITTGKTAEVVAALGPYAEALGVKIDSLSDLQAYEAIVQKLAPQMRVPGSGATSDFEMRAFLKALPGLGKTPEGNAIINNVFNAIAEQKIAAADIASKVLNKEITRSEGEKALRNLSDPMELWRKSKGALPSQSPKNIDIEQLVKKYAQ